MPHAHASLALDFSPRQGPCRAPCGRQVALPPLPCSKPRHPHPNRHPSFVGCPSEQASVHKEVVLEPHLDVVKPSDWAKTDEQMGDAVLSKFYPRVYPRVYPRSLLGCILGSHLTWLGAVAQVEVRELLGTHFFYKESPKTPDGHKQRGAFANVLLPPSNLQEVPRHFVVVPPALSARF